METTNCLAAQAMINTCTAVVSTRSIIVAAVPIGCTSIAAAIAWHVAASHSIEMATIWLCVWMQMPVNRFASRITFLGGEYAIAYVQPAGGNAISASQFNSLLVPMPAARTAGVATTRRVAESSLVTASPAASESGSGLSESVVGFDSESVDVQTSTYDIFQREDYAVARTTSSAQARLLIEALSVSGAGIAGASLADYGRVEPGLLFSMQTSRFDRETALL